MEEGLWEPEKRAEKDREDMMRKGDGLKILEGIYKSFEGEIILLAGEDVPKRVGVKLFHPKGEPTPSVVVWFKPIEVKTIK